MRYTKKIFHSGKNDQIRIRNHRVYSGGNLAVHKFKIGNILRIGNNGWVLIFILLFIGLACKLYIDRNSANNLSEGVIGVYTSNSLPITVANLISEPLVILDKSGQPQPHLSSWQVSSDAKIYTFKLKDNLYWNDGTAVKSSDLKFTLQDVEVSYPDEKSIQFKLPDSFSPFPTLLINPVFKGGSLIGLGQFKVVNEEFSRDIIKKLVLVPNGQKYPQITTVTIRFYPDEKTAVTAFELGEVESLIGVVETNGLLNNSSTLIKKITNFNRLVAVFFNTKDPILSDKNYRKALNCATPKITDEVEAVTSIPPSSWAFNTAIKDCLNDPETAKSYFNKVASGKDSTLVLTVVPALSQIGGTIVQSWKQIGVNAVLRIESGNPQNFQAVLLSQPIPLDPDQYSLWHSTQTKTNLSRYSDTGSSKRADKDLEEGRKIADIEKRKEEYLDLQKVLNDDPPADFLYFPKINVVYRKKAEVALDKVLSLQFN